MQSLMSAVQAVQTHMESHYPQESKRNFSLATASCYVAVKHQAHFCSQISNKEMEVWNMKVERPPVSDYFVKVFFKFLTYNL